MILLTKGCITLCSISLIHGLIDLASALVVYNVAIVHNCSAETATILTLIYNSLAFAFQPFAGVLIDNFKLYYVASLIGIILTLTGVLIMSHNALAAILFAGTGNALYHLGAGSQILQAFPKSASEIGVFTGPGAAGLSIGIWFGNHGSFPFWLLVISLLAAFVVLIFQPELKLVQSGSTVEHRQTGSNHLILLLVLIAIAIRGFVGRAGFTGLPNDTFTVIGLGTAACFGKMTGGILSDRFGASFTTAGALLLAGAGIICIQYHPFCALTSMFFFQMTMPVTLSATSSVLTYKPAAAFGLTCLALFLGTFPTFYIPPGIIQLPVLLLLIVMSGIIIIFALNGRLEREKNKRLLTN